MELLEILLETLKQDERFISQDWVLLKNTIREKAENLDNNLISLLLDNKVLRAKFFLKIKDVIVFDNNKFVKFINNKAFLPDSYTSFKNKIGLTNEKWDFIASSNEVVLSFPFKDCVLVGWQDKEDAKRDEIFYNEILRQDDIDRLFDKKVFTNFKRIDKDWEHKLEWFNRDENGTISDNLIIKWNNLLALHSLKSNFAWKVKLIYIDPPYNTWNDSFNYNDKFNHSTWLTFMKNRLEVAKELLTDDWVIFISCDVNELAHLKILMDEIFQERNFIEIFSWKKSDTPSNLAIKTKKVLEYVICYEKNKDNIKYIWNNNNSKSSNGLMNKVNPVGELVFPKHLIDTGLKDWIYKKWFYWTKSYKIELLEDTEVLNWFFNKKICLRGNFKWWQEKLDEEIKKWTKISIRTISFSPSYEKLMYEPEVPSNYISSDMWIQTTENAWKELLKIFSENIFNYPKSESLIEYLINMLSNKIKKNDIILDYHLWSWTTCAVAHKMGLQYIGIEQMDYIETISIERMKKVIEWEQSWISKNVEWKGGWEFVYMEIMQENERFIDTIKKAKNIKDLQSIYNQIKDSGFISYKVDTWSLKLDNLEEKDFEDFKLFLIEILDKNLLYKNYSERNDKNSNINKEDIIINSLFYK